MHGVVSFLTNYARYAVEDQLENHSARSEKPPIVCSVDGGFRGAIGISCLLQSCFAREVSPRAIRGGQPCSECDPSRVRMFVSVAPSLKSIDLDTINALDG